MEIVSALSNFRRIVVRNFVIALALIAAVIVPNSYADTPLDIVWVYVNDPGL